MKGLLLLSTVIAMVWLVIWLIRGETGRRGGWSPFDMRETRERQALGEAKHKLKTSEAAARQGWRGRRFR